MKNFQILLILIIFSLLFPACDDTSEETINVDETTIKMVRPEKVVVGQTIYITGSNFDEITEIILPENISIKDFERTGFNQLSVTAPAGMKSGLVTLRSETDEYVSPNEIEVVSTQFSNIFPVEVKTGEEITIKGENLIEVQQIIFPGDVVIDALHFRRKSDTEIIVVVPKNTIDGSGALQMVTISGEVISTTSINIEVAEIVEEDSKVDPITPNTIILLDYEPHGDHDGHWDNGWGGNTEIVTDEETGNSYLRVTGDINSDWIMNCNHQANIGDGATWPWSIDDAENYVLKLDVLVPFDVDGSQVKGIQFVLGDQWNYWYGDDLVPQSTDGEWLTVRVPLTRWDLQGFLDFSSGTNGLHGTVPKGICLDNLRIDPI